MQYDETTPIYQWITPKPQYLPSRPQSREVLLSVLLWVETIQETVGSVDLELWLWLRVAGWSRCSNTGIKQSAHGLPSSLDTTKEKDIIQLTLA